MGSVLDRRAEKNVTMDVLPVWEILLSRIASGQIFDRILNNTEDAQWSCAVHYR